MAMSKSPAQIIATTRAMTASISVTFRA
jgi:hypothetical protein